MSTRQLLPALALWATAAAAVPPAPPEAPRSPEPERPAKGSPAGDELEQRVARVVTGLPPVPVEGEELELSLVEWMEALGIPGLSLAVIDDYRIAWARGYGVVAAGGADAVTADTLFQAASISKPVTALAVLSHVERGTLALDAAANDLLRSWKLPENELTAERRVTVRQLLSHIAGVTPGGFLGYAAAEAQPELTRILDGEPPAANPPARVVAPPGSAVRYSGLGYTILQQMLVDRLGRPFPEIVREAVLEPLALRSSTFEQHLPAELARRAASGHYVTGAVVDGGWRLHPEMAAAGLWTTPSDLATLAVEVARSKAGRSDRVLSPVMTAEMLRQQHDRMGLGFVVDPESEHGYFAHSGGNQGYRCHLRMLADAGKGVVIMTNSDAGSLLFSALIASVAREHRWPSRQRPELAASTVDGIAAQLAIARTRRREIEVDPAVLARYVGVYQLAPGLRFDVALDAGRLTVRLGEQPRFPVYAESETRFFYKVVDAQITFVEDGEGAVSALILHQGGRGQRAPRVE